MEFYKGYFWGLLCFAPVGLVTYLLFFSNENKEKYPDFAERALISLGALALIAFVIAYLVGAVANERAKNAPRPTPDPARRAPIPQAVKNQVWNRAGGRCEYCGSNEFLEFDHIVPVSRGGSNSYRNLQLLCEPCNRKKGTSL